MIIYFVKSKKIYVNIINQGEKIMILSGLEIKNRLNKDIVIKPFDNKKEVLKPKNLQSLSFLYNQNKIIIYIHIYKLMAFFADFFLLYLSWPQ